jgi:hypothetical protein
MLKYYKYIICLMVVLFCACGGPYRYDGYGSTYSSEEYGYRYSTPYYTTPFGAPEYGYPYYPAGIGGGWHGDPGDRRGR